MKLLAIFVLTSFASLSAFADAGTLYTCRWDHEQDGFFTVLEGSEETAHPYYIVKSDETNYFVAKDSPEAQKELSLEINATMIPGAPSSTLRVTTYNDSVNTATCWK
jgi:hypothetical protein